MIYISSSCIKSENILEVLEIFHNRGIKNIELSGGTKFYNGLEEKLIDYVNKKRINVRLHNYFPPPKEDFVINLASLNKEIHEKSLIHCIKAINLSKKLGADRFSVHAGFLLDPGVKEIGIGNNLVKKKLYDFNLGIKKMIDSLQILYQEAGRNFKIYVENNVISQANYLKYENNPFLLTTSQDYKMFKSKIKLNLLLDIAHLKVSSNSLKKNFNFELEYLFNQTDYIHLSGNNSLEDSNKSLLSDNEITNFLKRNGLKNKTFTLEVYEGIDKIIQDYNFLNNL